MFSGTLFLGLLCGEMTQYSEMSLTTASYSSSDAIRTEVVSFMKCLNMGGVWGLDFHTLIKRTCAYRGVYSKLWQYIYNHQYNQVHCLASFITHGITLILNDLLSNLDIFRDTLLCEF